MTLESEEAERRLKGVSRGQSKFRNAKAKPMAEGIHEHLARPAAGLSLVNASPERVRKSRSDSAQPLRGGTGDEHLGKATVCHDERTSAGVDPDLWGHSPGKPS